jgi:hypothetical protein
MFLDLATLPMLLRGVYTSSLPVQPEMQSFTFKTKA